MVADDPESFADLDGHNQAPGIVPDPSGLGGCRDMILCENAEQQGQSDQKKDPPQQSKSTVQKAEDALDWFNEYLGFGKRTTCGQGGDCVNALGMAATAVIAAVVSGGASEEAFVEKQLATATARIENIATKDLIGDTLAGAKREIEGGMRVAKAGGGEFDHVGKVQRAIRGLNRQITHLERVLQRSGLSESQVKRIRGLIESGRGLIKIAQQAITREAQ
jgi:hypothetical protein